MYSELPIGLERKARKLIQLSRSLYMRNYWGSMPNKSLELTPLQGATQLKRYMVEYRE